MNAVQSFTMTHPRWALERGALRRTYTFPTFPAAIAFVNAAAELAEREQHHPDLDIRYSSVTVALVTHDRGHRVTELDTNLAAELDAVAERLLEAARG